LSSSVKESKFTIYLKIIKSSLKGDEYDFTAIDLRKAVILLAIPMMLELALESVFAVVDIFFVNKLGVHAVSVVGLTESVITLVYSVGIGLSAAGTAVVARRIGEKRTEDAAYAAAQVIILSVIASVLIAVPGFIFAGDILRLMGAEPAAVEEGIWYARLMFGGNVVIILLFVINGIFRGAGNASIAMKSLWLGNIFNIILDPLFIFGIAFFPQLGVTGAAVATVCGRAIAVLYQVYHLKMSTGIIKLKLHHFKPDSKLLKELTGIGWPAAFQFIIASASWIFLAAMVAAYGSAVSAAYQTAIRLFVFFILPAWGLSNAAATLVGQNLGAKEPARAEKSVRITAKYTMIFMGIVTILILVFSSQLIGIFVPESESEQMKFAILALRIISSGYIFYGLSMVMTQAFNGAGDTKTPTWVFFFGFWLFQVPLAFVLHTYTSIGVSGIFLAVPVAETLMAIAIYMLFKKGKWKLKNV